MARLLTSPISFPGKVVASLLMPCSFKSVHESGRSKQALRVALNLNPAVLLRKQPPSAAAVSERFMQQLCSANSLVSDWASQAAVLQVSTQLFQAVFPELKMSLEISAFISANNSIVGWIAAPQVTCKNILGMNIYLQAYR